MRTLALSLALLLTPIAAHGQEAIDNPEMAALFKADQAARGAGPIDWEKVNAEDAQRRVTTRRLLDRGALQTADDYYWASFIFQYGAKPADFLLAHVLATRALALGRKDAEWMVASTLDRYLQKSGAGQVYGTQFQYTTEKGTTQEPYDRQLLPDSVRVAAGAHTLAEQQAHLADAEASMKALFSPPKR